MIAISYAMIIFPALGVWSICYTSN